ncbi:MAG: phosphoribosyltransferase [Nitrososphaeria archaeon]
MEKRLVSWNEFGRLTVELVKKVKASGISFDVVIGIARGGLPISMVIADRLSVPLDFINIKSYKGPGLKIPAKIFDVLYVDVRNKSVLVVDDTVDTGETLLLVSGHLIKNRGASNVQIASLFVKPWAKVKPNFYVKEVDYWIVFPWELRESEMEEYESKSY